MKTPWWIKPTATVAVGVALGIAASRYDALSAVLNYAWMLVTPFAVMSLYSDAKNKFEAGRREVLHVNVDARGCIPAELEQIVRNGIARSAPKIIGKVSQTFWDIDCRRANRS